MYRLFSESDEKDALFGLDTQLPNYYRKVVVFIVPKSCPIMCFMDSWFGSDSEQTWKKCSDSKRKQRKQGKKAAREKEKRVGCRKKV
jgi:hypothetical protein